MKEAKGAKGLGAGSAISLAHRSELCNYGNIAGLEHFRHSLARSNPNRLFVDESTALGFNIWYEIWTESKQDHHCVLRLLRMSGRIQGSVIEKTDPDFEVYGFAPLTELEREKIQTVYRQYGHEITVEQVAWIRREMNPVAKQEGDADADYSGDPSRWQQQPWTEEDAFQMTGAIFFDSEKLTDQANKHVSPKFQTYSFFPGFEFTDFRAAPAHNAKSVELKVWGGTRRRVGLYQVAADVAFGHDEKNDRSAIQVLRCFADGLDQVAEYAWPLINTRQFAWVIAAIEG